MLRSLLLACMLASLSALGGCVTIGQTIYRTGHDPDQAKAVAVAGIKDGQLVLADGRSFRPQGVDLAGLADDDIPSRDRYRIQPVFVTEQHGQVGRAVQFRPRYSFEMDRWEGWLPVFKLFPHYEDVSPERVDVAMTLVELGLAKVVPEEIPDPAIRARYLELEQKARLAKTGRWRDMPDPN